MAGVRLSAWGKTDVGRMRDHNEDAIVVDGPHQLFVVADGVGGRQAGEVAASMVAKHIHTSFRAFHAQWVAPGPTRWEQAIGHLMTAMPQWLNEASEAIFNEAAANAVRQGMKTTVVAFVMVGSRAVVAHVGDSRLHLIRGGQIYQLTKDHTLLQMYLDLGVLQPEQANTFKHRHVLSQSIGGKPTVQVATSTIDVFPGDRFVACSDGLSDLVNADTIKDVVQREAPEAATSALIELANARGGRDNVTVVVVAADEPTAQQPRQEERRNEHPRMRSEQKIELLKGIPIFADLSFQERLRVLSSSGDLRVPAGTRIVTEGEDGREFFVILHGDVSVTKSGTEVNRIGTGGHFGELALITDGKRTATVTAMAHSHVIRLSRDSLMALIQNDPALGVKLLWRFSQNLGNQVIKLTNTLASPRRY